MHSRKTCSTILLLNPSSDNSGFPFHSSLVRINCSFTVAYASLPFHCTRKKLSRTTRVFSCKEESFWRMLEYCSREALKSCIVWFFRSSTKSSGPAATVPIMSSFRICCSFLSALSVSSRRLSNSWFFVSSQLFFRNTGSQDACIFRSVSSSFSTFSKRSFFAESSWNSHRPRSMICLFFVTSSCSRIRNPSFAVESDSRSSEIAPIQDCNRACSSSNPSRSDSKSVFSRTSSFLFAINLPIAHWRVIFRPEIRFSSRSFSVP